MTKIEQIADAIDSIQEIHPVFKEITNDLIKQSSRLYYLLYEKDRNYEGPLYNGLQKNDWTMITFLVTNWIIETLHINSKIKYEKIKKDLIDYGVTKFAIQIIKALIIKDIIEMQQSEKPLVLLFLDNEEILHFVNNQIEKIITKISNCCISRKTVLKITNKTGNKCTFANDLKSIQP